MKNKRVPRRFGIGGKQNKPKNKLYRLPSEMVRDSPEVRDSLINDQRTRWEMPRNLTWKDFGDPSTTGPYGSGPLKQDVLDNQDLYDFMLDNPRAVNMVEGNMPAIEHQFNSEAGDHWRSYKYGSNNGKEFLEYHGPGGASSQKLDKKAKKVTWLDRLFGL